MTHPGKEALSRIAEDMLSSPVADISVISRPQLEAIASAFEEVERERDEAREALSRMEDCSQQLAATRSHEIYVAMIDGGQAQALLDLDNARRNARQVIAALKSEEPK